MENGLKSVRIVLKDNKEKRKSEMQKIQMTVRGQVRNVYVEKWLDKSKKKARARTYVGSSVVSGTLQKCSNGTLRFTPSGVNADLV